MSTVTYCQWEDFIWWLVLLSDQAEKQEPAVMQRLPLKKVYPSVWHHAVLRTSCFKALLFVICSLVPLQQRHESSGIQTLRSSVKRCPTLLMRAINGSVVILPLFCLHRSGRRTNLLQDCPWTGLAANLLCRPSLLLWLLRSVSAFFNPLSSSVFSRWWQGVSVCTQFTWGQLKARQRKGERCEGYRDERTFRQVAKLWSDRFFMYLEVSGKEFD